MKSNGAQGLIILELILLYESNDRQSQREGIEKYVKIFNLGFAGNLQFVLGG